MTACEDAFASFLEDIALTTQQVERAESAISGLRSYLTSTFDLAEDDIFLQGSYATGTAIKPRPGGEYDVDIVAITSNWNESTNFALNTMADKLRESPRYASRIETPKKRCVRLRYAEQGTSKFHVDVVPLRKIGSQLQSPVRSEEWKDTNPIEFAEWSQSLGDQFIQVIKIIKRWRDEQQEVRAAVKSILLQVLISQVYIQAETLAETITLVFEGLHNYLRPHLSPPYVPNPRMAWENLADRWTTYEFERFKKQVESAADLSRKAFNQVDSYDSQLQWKEVLGTAFPTPKSIAALAQNSAIAAKHLEPPTARGWIERLDPRYGISVTADVYSSNGRVLIKNLQSNGDTLRDDWNVRFHAHPSGPQDAGIWWQVLNSGPVVELAHSQGQVSAFRGNFFRAKLISGANSPDLAQNWERTEYTGQHWIRCALVKASSIVAYSDLFFVNIRNRTAR